MDLLIELAKSGRDLKRTASEEARARRQATRTQDEIDRGRRQRAEDAARDRTARAARMADRERVQRERAATTPRRSGQDTYQAARVTEGLFGDKQYQDGRWRRGTPSGDERVWVPAHTITRNGRTIQVEGYWRSNPRR